MLKIMEKGDIIKSLNKVVSYQADYSEDYREYIFKGYLLTADELTQQLRHSAILKEKNINSSIQVDMRKVMIEDDL